jgi:DNA-directed RNA polymerase specialized sigma24 family protein
VDDTRLIEGFRAGSRTDFATLVERHSSAVHSFLSRLSGAGTAENLTHQTFAAAWLGASSYSSDRPARLWLLGIAVKQAAAAEGFDGRLSPPATLPALGPAPKKELPAGEAAGRLVAQAVSELPFPQRVVLILRAYLDFGVPQIAAVLETRGDSVAALLAAAYNGFVRRFEQRAGA